VYGIYYDSRPVVGVAQETVLPINEHLAFHPAAARLKGLFDAGDVMDIHLWSSGPAPANSFTAEFKLFNSDDQIISFGSANPVRATYYQSEHRHFVCRLGPLPLTEGSYTFSFTVRVWNRERWDYWDKAIGFTIGRCDLFNSGHGISSVNDGDFVIQQEWLVGD